MEGDGAEVAQPVKEPVYVCAHGEGTWVVYLGMELLLVTHDGEEAYQAGCKASGGGIERPLIVQSGPSWRPPEALSSRIEQSGALIGDRQNCVSANAGGPG